MKRFIFLLILVLSVSELFAEIRWNDVEENDDGITAYVYCTTKEEVLEVTHWKDLNTYFKSYTQDTEPAKKDFYLIIIMNLGTIVYEYHKGTKSIGYYVKTIFE